MKDLKEDLEILSKIKSVEFFKEFMDNEEIIDKIANMCSRKKFKKDSYIIKEGDTGEDLFIVIKGIIKIVKKTLQKEEYTVINLNSDKRGGITVGELALIDSDRRSASVIADTDCVCLVITRNKFLKFGDDNPDIGLSITRAISSQLARSLRKANADVITLFSALINEIADDE
ncbi:cyclic nucleotide-binding domain-containing protein [Spirochaetota bacterium]